MSKKPEPKSAPGRQVLVIGMDVPSAKLWEYRARGVLIVTAGWIADRAEIPASVLAVWGHPDVEKPFREKFAKQIKKLGDRAVQFRSSIDQMNRFIDLYHQPLADIKFEPKAASTPKANLDESKSVDLRRDIGRLETLLNQANEQLAEANAENGRINAKAAQTEASQRSIIQSLNDAVAQLRNELLTNIRKRVEPEKAPESGVIAKLRGELEQTRANLSKLSAEVRQERARADRLQIELKGAKAALVQERARRVDLVVLEASTSIERLQRELAIEKASLAQLREEIKEEKRRFKQLENENRRLQRELKEAQAIYVAGFLSVWAQGQEKRSTAIERQTTIIKEAQETISGFESKVEELQDQLKVANKVLVQQASTVAKLRSELLQAETRATGYYRRLHERETIASPERAKTDKRRRYLK